MYTSLLLCHVLVIEIGLHTQKHNLDYECNERSIGFTVIIMKIGFSRNTFSDQELYSVTFGFWDAFSVLAYYIHLKIKIIIK